MFEKLWVIAAAVFCAIGLWAGFIAWAGLSEGRRNPSNALVNGKRRRGQQGALPSRRQVTRYYESRHERSDEVRSFSVNDLRRCIAGSLIAL